MRYNIVLLQATRVSFDFDDTLTTDRGKELAKQEIAKGNEVWIITARQSSDNGPVYKVAEELGIDKAHVVFTNGADKWKAMIQHRITKHYDNNKEQVDKIKKNTDTKAIKF